MTERGADSGRRSDGRVRAVIENVAPCVDSGRFAVKRVVGRDVALEAKVDPALIGGLIVKVGSRMIDGSLRTKLNSLKLAMKEVG